jgi:streptomycin 6-kinase
LLHADLHHENVLLGPTGWMAIDPKGARGPACLEVGRYVQNRLPLEVEARGQALRSRLRLLAEALEEREGVLARVALVDCVLSLCWTLEELELGADYDAGLQTAGLIISMIDDLR